MSGRNWVATPAVRERVPIWLGLFGPPGSGKTYSALRLATGIAKETGGKIFVIDTEARRSLHYADDFSFQHIDMAQPFGSIDYLDAAEFAVRQGAGIIIIDSQSHEHEGPGGYIDTHTTETDRLSQGDYAKRERVQLLAWQKPGAARTRMVNSLGQLGPHIIACFRAKDSVKPQKNPRTGKVEIVEQGWVPISGTQLLYSMTCNMLLYPRSNGVPTWDTEYPGERQMMKLPKQFAPLFADKRPLDEEHGVAFAKWAAGHATASATAADFADAVGTLLAEAAATGTADLKAAWLKLPRDVQAQWKERLETEFKPIAAKIDKAEQEAHNAQPAHAT